MLINKDNLYGVSKKKASIGTTPSFLYSRKHKQSIGHSWVSNGHCAFFLHKMPKKNLNWAFEVKKGINTQ